MSRLRSLLNLVFVVVAFFGLTVSVSAQQANRLHVFNGLNRSTPGFPQLALTNQTSFSISRSPVWTETAPVTLPTIVVNGPRTLATTSAGTDAKDFSKEVPEMELSRPYYVHGEVGVMAGVSTGRFAHDFEGGYIFGDVGNDKTQISAGASYERSNWHIPRH